MFRARAEVTAKNVRIFEMETVDTENATLKEKVFRLRGVLITAREALAVLPTLQETNGQLENENKLLLSRLLEQVSLKWPRVND